MSSITLATMRAGEFTDDDGALYLDAEWVKGEGYCITFVDPARMSGAVISGPYHRLQYCNLREMLGAFAREVNKARRLLDRDITVTYTRDLKHILEQECKLLLPEEVQS